MRKYLAEKSDINFDSLILTSLRGYNYINVKYIISNYKRVQLNFSD